MRRDGSMARILPPRSVLHNVKQAVRQHQQATGKDMLLGSQTYGGGQARDRSQSPTATAGMGNTRAPQRSNALPQPTGSQQTLSAPRALNDSQRLQNPVAPSSNSTDLLAGPRATQSKKTILQPTNQTTFNKSNFNKARPTPSQTIPAKTGPDKGVVGNRPLGPPKKVFPQQPGLRQPPSGPTRPGNGPARGAGALPAGSQAPKPPPPNTFPNSNTTARAATPTSNGTPLNASAPGLGVRKGAAAPRQPTGKLFPPTPAQRVPLAGHGQGGNVARQPPTVPRPPLGGQRQPPPGPRQPQIGASSAVAGQRQPLLGQRQSPSNGRKMQPGRGTGPNQTLGAARPKQKQAKSGGGCCGGGDNNDDDDEAVALAPRPQMVDSSMPNASKQKAQEANRKQEQEREKRTKLEEKRRKEGLKEQQRQLIERQKNEEARRKKEQKDRQKMAKKWKKQKQAGGYANINAPEIEKSGFWPDNEKKKRWLFF